MIAPVAIAGILIMAILANQAFAYYRSGSSSVKCKIYGGHTYCKSKHRHGNFGASNTGNAAQESSNGNRATPQGASNTAPTQMKCTTGYIWLPSGGFRHCSLGTVVNAPQGSSSTSGGVQKSSNTAPTPQESSNKATTPQGASNTATIQMKCTTGYIWLPSGGFRHCSLGTVVNAPQGSSSTSGGVQKSSNTATTPQG